MTLPDFCLIGAMKCGTSTIAAQLDAQPGIFMTSPKEPNFFSDDDVWAQGPEWYAALFAGSVPGDLKGEASTHYTKLPTYPKTLERMTSLLESVRLIYVVRDPIQRAVSHFIHEWTERRMSGTLDDAITRYPELIEYGLYAKQITPFIDAYGHDAICLTSLERVKADPQSELERIARHIGLAKPPMWQKDLKAQNVSGERLRKLPFHKLLVDHPVSSRLRRALVPQSIRTRLAQARQFGDRPVLSQNMETHLWTRFATDQAQLAELFPGVLDTLQQPEVV